MTINEKMTLQSDYKKKLKEQVHEVTTQLEHEKKENSGLKTKFEDLCNKEAALLNKTQALSQQIRNLNFQYIDNDYANQAKQLNSELVESKNRNHIKLNQLERRITSLKEQFIEKKAEVVDLQEIRVSLEQDIAKYQKLLNEGEMQIGIPRTPKKRKLTNYTTIPLQGTDDKKIRIVQLLVVDQCVVLKNESDADQYMTGWILQCDNPKLFYKFPERFIFRAKGTLKIGANGLMGETNHPGSTPTRLN